MMEYVFIYNGVRQLNTNELKAVMTFVVIRDIWLLGVQLGSLERNRGCDCLGGWYFDFHIQFIKNWIKNNNIF